MKILFVLEYFWPHVGGVENLFDKLASELAKVGHECTIITTRYDPSLAKEERRYGYQIIRLPLRNRYLFTLFSLNRIVRLARDHDVIHTTTYNAALPAWIASRLARKPVLVTFHEVWGKLWFKLPGMNFIGKAMHWLFEQLLLKLSFNMFIAVSQSTLDDLIEAGISESQVKLIYNGIDYSKIAAVKRDILSLGITKSERFSFLYFGRLGVSKGVNLLVEAIPEFAQLGHQATFCFVIPKEKNRLFDQIYDLQANVNDNIMIEIHHNLSEKDVMKQVMKAHSVALPSYSEGFCFAAAETVALETPIISSQKKALKEVVGGKFIEMQSLDVHGMVLALDQALKGQWKYKEPVQFDIERTIEGYWQCYESLFAN